MAARVKENELIKLVKQAEIINFFRGIVASILIEGYDKTDDELIVCEEFMVAVDKINRA